VPSAQLVEGGAGRLRGVRRGARGLFPVLVAAFHFGAGCGEHNPFFLSNCEASELLSVVANEQRTLWIFLLR